jgi:hypothetical protein
MSLFLPSAVKQPQPQSKSQPQPQPQPLLTNKNKKKKPLTNTNTDKECLRADAGFLRRAVYVIDTHNGFKFFNIVERTACHVLAWLCFATVATYSFVFVQGLIDGFSTETFATTTAATAATVSSTTEDATKLLLPFSE